MNRRERLIQSRKKAKLSQAALAEMMGVKQPYIAAIEKSGDFSYKQAEVLAKLLKVDPNWLFFDIDDIPMRTPQELRSIMEAFAEVEANTVREPSNVTPYTNELAKPNMYIVPIKAYGGFLTGYESHVYLNSLEKARFPFVKGECFAFEVDGFSMYKDYVPGDFVVTTPVENLEWLSKGKVYVFQTVDGIILKCFDKIEDDHIHLYSLNEEYNPVKPIHLKDVKKVYFKEKVIKN